MATESTATSDREPSLTYDEAAKLLGIKRESVKQLVSRGHLHSVPAPEDRRRRRLLRSEVEAYARIHAGKWSYADTSARADAQVASAAPPALSKELLIAGAASLAALVLLIAAFRIEMDPGIRAAVIGAVIALGLVLLAEWERQGKIDAAQRRRLEQLAKQAEVKPEEFVQELERFLPQVEGAAR